MTSVADLGARLFIDVEGLRIRYVRSPGDDEKTPVLLVSPFPESLYAYDDFWADLSQAAPLVALDLPGFGQSEGRPELMTSEAMGTFVTKTLVALGLQRVHAIGPDVGTSALLFAASQKPEMFESLVVGSGGTDVARTASLKDIIYAASTDDFAAVDGADYTVAVLEKRAQKQASPLRAQRLSRVLWRPSRRRGDDLPSRLPHLLAADAGEASRHPYARPEHLGRARSHRASR
jgi:pimeloyl-ACP methyl ester carboxylesterase